jgi:hypothetical protein
MKQDYPLGKGQMCLPSDRRQRVGEVLRSFAPHDVMASSKFSSQFLKGTSEVKVFGLTHDCVAPSIDVNGIGNIRYQWCGTTDVVLVPWVALEQVAKKDGVTISDQEEVPSFIKRLLSSLDAKHFDIETLACRVFHWKFEAGQVLVVPPGFGIIERACLCLINCLQDVSSNNKIFFGLHLASYC